MGWGSISMEGTAWKGDSPLQSFRPYWGRCGCSWWLRCLLGFLGQIWSAVVRQQNITLWSIGKLKLIGRHEKELGCHFQCKSQSSLELTIGRLQRDGHQVQARAVGSPMEAVSSMYTLVHPWELPCNSSTTPYFFLTRQSSLPHMWRHCPPPPSKKIHHFNSLMGLCRTSILRDTHPNDVMPYFRGLSFSQAWSLA